MTSSEIRLLDFFAAFAPEPTGLELERMRRGEASVKLNADISKTPYADPSDHDYQARARFAWAQAMAVESERIRLKASGGATGKELPGH